MGAGPAPGVGRQPVPARRHESANLADILERVLDKGIVIAGDIQVNLLDIELLTIKLRLIVASVDRAKEMGIDWWERDPTLSSRAGEVEEENRLLRRRLSALEAGADPESPRYERAERYKQDERDEPYERDERAEPYERDERAEPYERDERAEPYEQDEQDERDEPYERQERAEHADREERAERHARRSREAPRDDREERRARRSREPPRRPRDE
jgi:hypothetical protein